MSRVRRSNVQTVLSGEQLIDQVLFGLLWLLWWIDEHVRSKFFVQYQFDVKYLKTDFFFSL